MKFVLVTLVLLAALAATSNTQENLAQGVYAPFTQEEIQSVTAEPASQNFPEHTEPRPHHKRHKKDLKHGGPHEEELMAEAEEEEYGSDLTEEEREERRIERRRYNKIFRVGMLVGTAVLAVIIFKFCKAKRIRNRNRMMQQQHQQQQMMVQQQPYLYSLNQPAPIHPHAFPSIPVQPVQPVQMGRPYQQPIAVPAVRGRVHDSFIRPQQHPVESATQAQIRFHEAEIQRLRQMRQGRQEVEMQRVPINTTESFESHQPINRYRNVPVGQPVYPKDANSSFASEYPEI